MTPVFEDSIDQPDGIKTIFDTQYTYVAGTVRVFVNGQLKTVQRADGWKELGGKKVLLKEVLRADDHLIFYYLPLV